ncbi:MAG: hypothetical protein V2J19_06530 [Wenzhouxiangella sp.]|nr:hypothetical protein [Wenzhouxiangella sp.]
MGDSISGKVRSSMTISQFLLRSPLLLPACLTVLCVGASDVALSAVPRAAADMRLAPQARLVWPESESTSQVAGIRQFERGGTIRTVGAEPECDYANLGDALIDALDGDTIRLAESGDYVGQTYQILNFDGQLTIDGGYQDCDTTTPAGKTVLDANGAGRVFYIEQSTGFVGTDMQIVLKDIEVVNGDNSGSFGGGGMMINGTPGILGVTLENVTVRDNQSTSRGGGIHVRVNGDRAGAGTMLTMDNSSNLLSNSSGENGGGLACSSLGNTLDTTTLVRLGAVGIRQNTSVDGAGIYVDGCKRVFAYIGYDVSQAGSIANNGASGDGGGVSVVNGGEAFIRGDAFGDFGIPSGAAEIQSNSAQLGGGVHVAGDGSYVFLGDAVLDRNFAEFRGGGIHVEQSGRVVMHRLQDQPCVQAEATQNPRCSRIIDNDVLSSTSGMAIEVNSMGEIEVVRTEITGHSGSGMNRLIAIDSREATPTEATSGFFEGVSIHGNTGLGTVFTPNNSAVLTLAWSTISENEAGNVVRTGSGDADVDIYSSVIWEDSGAVFERAGFGAVTASLDCVVGHQLEGDLDVDSYGYYSRIDPEFVDAPNGDLRLGPTSPAIDYCDDFNAAQYSGIDGNTRGLLHRGQPLTDPPASVAGAQFDLGAFEMNYVIDQLFSDRFE